MYIDPNTWMITLNMIANYHYDQLIAQSQGLHVSSNFSLQLVMGYQARRGQEDFHHMYTYTDCCI